MTNTLHGEYCLMRMMGDTLLITHAQLELTLQALPGQDKLKQADLVVRMQFWLENILDGCIVLPMNREYGLNWLESVGNPIMFCPDEPNDMMLQLLIHAKLNAIGQGMIIVNSTHMSTELGRGLGTFFDGDPNDMLPSNTDWMGPAHFYTKPWWNRSDAGMMDVVAKDGSDLLQVPDILIPWEDLIPIDDQLSPARSAEIIRPAFKPTIINND